MRPAHVVAALVGERVAAFELGIAAQVFGLDRSDEGFAATGFLLCGPRPGWTRACTSCAATAGRRSRTRWPGAR
ncbi:hypothetical protein [Kineococcus rhizosphaerae]|uniref:Uncharacterized protein n=1 Tax=Kineococcus rhizosphaerae TaxID=559628 RepID=A0A2T0R5T8_9ACTN|nr:hypothetical protein [Kineococcus rhizosphaerae]PRY16120.1 hypothetical protein CLV37_104340 [Kineococcus rhizosphaerae]